MTKDKLSLMYMIATMRVHQVTSNMYESLHDLDGDPLEDPDAVKELITQFKKAVIEEISLALASTQEFTDEKGHEA